MPSDVIFFSERFFWQFQSFLFFPEPSFELWGLEKTVLQSLNNTLHRKFFYLNNGQLTAEKLVNSIVGRIINSPYFCCWGSRLVTSCWQSFSVSPKICKVVFTNWTSRWQDFEKIWISIWWLNFWKHYFLLQSWRNFYSERKTLSEFEL